MSCKSCCEKTTDYLEDSLQWRDRIAMRIHFAVCPDCRRFMAHISRASNVAKQCLRPPVFSQLEAEDLAVALHSRFPW